MDDLSVPFTLDNPWAFALHGLPLRCSVPFPQGGVREPAQELVLTDEQGRDLAAQWRVLSSWKDGSVRFALMDYAEAVVPPQTTRRYTLGRRQGDEPTAEPAATIRVDNGEDALEIDTGRLRWTLGKSRFSWARSVHFDGRELVGGEQSDLCVTDLEGQVYRASEGEYELTLEEAGPHRVVLLVRGDHRNAGGKFMDYRLRLHFTAGGSQVLMLHTVRNRETGREGRDLRRLWLTGGLALGPGAVRRVLHEARTKNTIRGMVEIPENVDLDVGDAKTLIRHGASLREDPEDVCYSVQQGIDGAGYGACSPLIDLHQPGRGGMLFKLAMAKPNEEAPCAWPPTAIASRSTSTRRWTSPCTSTKAWARLATCSLTSTTTPSNPSTWSTKAPTSLIPASSAYRANTIGGRNLPTST